MKWYNAIAAAKKDNVMTFQKGSAMMTEKETKKKIIHMLHEIHSMQALQRIYNFIMMLFIRKWSNRKAGIIPRFFWYDGHAVSLWWKSTGA